MQMLSLLKLGALLTVYLYFYIYDTLHDLVPFVQLKTEKKHSWRSVTFSKVVECSSSMDVFTFKEWYQIAQSIPCFNCIYKLTAR